MGRELVLVVLAGCSFEPRADGVISYPGDACIIDVGGHVDASADAVFDAAIPPPVIPLDAYQHGVTTGRNWPTHDPCGMDGTNQLTNVVERGGGRSA